MPKMKSNRAARKRFTVTGTGKIVRGHNHMRHKLTHKSAKAKRILGHDAIVADADVLRVKRLILA
ncbi:MAG: 50S ribosomal protein L35 [bacterium]|nr:50S ribosomal protein L35 [bacterium]